MGPLSGTGKGQWPQVPDQSLRKDQLSGKVLHRRRYCLVSGGRSQRMESRLHSDKGPALFLGIAQPENVRISGPAAAGLSYQYRGCSL